MQIIQIKYPRGHMSIKLDTFFPTSQSNFKKLLRVIEMDWMDQDDHIQKIKNWLIEEIRHCEDMAKEYANKYVGIKPKVREAEARVRETEYHLSILKQRTPAYKSIKSKFMELKKEYQKLKSLESSYDSSFKKYHSRREKLQKNLEVLA